MVVKIDASVVAEEIMNVIIICNIAACWTEEPPRIAPVIIPGIAMMPITLEGIPLLASSYFWWLNNAPHLVYHRGERHDKRSFCDRPAGFHPGRAESEIHLYFVTVFTVMRSEIGVEFLVNCER